MSNQSTEAALPARVLEAGFVSYDSCVSPQHSLPANKQVTYPATPGLSVTITKTPPTPLTYQWLEDGTVIAGETGSSCCTAAAVSGTYTARVINSCGKGEAFTAVTVCGNPTVRHPAKRELLWIARHVDRIPGRLYPFTSMATGARGSGPSVSGETSISTGQERLSNRWRLPNGMEICEMIRSPLPPDVTEAISPLTDIGFEIANHITDPVHFGDLMISLVRSDVRLRVLRDRGEWFVDVGSTRDLNEWFDSRLVLRMSGSLDVQEIVCDLSLLRAYSEIRRRQLSRD